MNSPKIAIATPIGVETGGPEALHQLCSKLRILGFNAYLYPIPGTENATPVERYKNYNAPIDTSLDSKNLLIVPEIVPEMIKFSKRSIIWWLSVDNSPLNRYSQKELLDFRHKNRNQNTDVQKVQSPDETEFWEVFFSNNVYHYAQSYYAKNTLKSKFQLSSKMLTDYINNDYTLKFWTRNKSQISFGLKGSEHFEYFKNSLVNHEVVRIVNFTRSEVIENLAKTRLFIDLGHQPGRDRMPREASLLKAHVMLNSAGAGDVFRDAPLSKKFKIDLENKELSLLKILSYLNRSPKPSLSQIAYRRWVESQERTFENEVKNLVKIL
jgi:hypothetical protein